MNRRHLLFALPVVVLILWIAYPFAITSDWAKALFPESNWGRRGVIGDSFGALNTLFAGLALAGLAINISLQNEQIRRLNRREDENEDQLARQAEALRLTALLHYYNSEVDLFERLAHRFENPDPKDPDQKDFWDRFTELREGRAEVVRELKAPGKPLKRKEGASA